MFGNMVVRRRRVKVQAWTIVAAVASVLASDGGTVKGSPRLRHRYHLVAARRPLADEIGRVPALSSLSVLLTVPRGGGVGGSEDGWSPPRRRRRRRQVWDGSPADMLSRLVRSVIGRDGGGESPAAQEGGGDDDEAARTNQGSGLKQISLPDLSVENFLRIDFSGDLDCHLLGPSHHHPQFESTSLHGAGSGGPRGGPASRRSSTAALVRSRNPWTPNWIVGVRYDFAQCWYGATRAWSHLQLLLFPPPIVPIFSSTASSLVRPRMLLPVAVDWTTDRSLRDGTDRTNEAAFYWKRSVQDRLSTCLRGRVDSATTAATGTSNPAKATLTLQVPLHHRFSYECRVVSDAIPAFLQKASWLLSPSSSNDRDISYDSHRSRGFRLPDVTRLDDDGWWLPDVTLRASGHIESRNAAVLPHPTRLYDGRVAVRFTIRRNLLWNRFGDDADDDDDGYGGDNGGGSMLLLSSVSPLTTIGVEIHDIQSHAMNGIVLQTELERPLHALRMAFVQQLYRPA